MSLALAMSTNLNRDICMDMAVNSKIENVPSATPLHQQRPVFHSHDGEHCCGLPYQDHNYGAPPPPPTPPLSPNEPCFKPLMSNPNMVCVKSCPTTVSPPPSVPTNALYQNGLEKPSEVTQNNVSFFPNSLSSESSGDITRCICGFTHDDGYMICCDKCGVWQHIDCMNIDRNNIPETYDCDRCNPRHVDKEQAFLLQSKKKEDLSMASELDSDIESGDDTSNVQSRIHYTSVQSTPTSLTITSNRNGKKTAPHFGSGKKRKRSKDESKRIVKRFNSADKKARSRSRSKSSCLESPGEDKCVENNHFVWENKLREWTNSYVEIYSNQYTQDLLQSVLSASKKLNEKNHNDTILSQLHKQLAKVQQLKNCVMAMEDISVAMPIAEVCGTYMLSNQFEGCNSVLYKRPYPFVFFYTGFDGLEICVDARLSGNVSRYLRRSCHPNSEVKHVMENNKLHLFVYSKENIPSGEEVTIPFDFKYQNCAYNVECGCGRPDICPVFKSSKLKAEQFLRNATKQHVVQDEFGKKKLSPLVLPLSRINPNGNGYLSSDHESSHAYGDVELDESGRLENQRKKSREERKMEAYIRAFEKMEKQEKKKELHHNHTPHSKPEPITLCRDSVKTSVHPVSGELSEEYLTPSQVVTPNRRTNRRRSTRGGRRNTAKRGRMTSFEGVLSPSMAMETDSNHSYDSTTALSNMSERIASLDSEQSGLSAGQSMPEIVDEMTRFSESGDGACEYQTGARTSESSDMISTEDSKHSVNPVELPPSMNTSEAPTTVEAHNQLGIVTKTSEDLPEQKDTTSSSSVEQPPTANNTVTKSAKTKKNGSTEGQTSAPCNSSAATPTNDPPVLCSFMHWDYRPGIPSGHVRIGISSQPERRCSTQADKFIKKRWLQRAIKEDLLPKPGVGVTPINGDMPPPNANTTESYSSFKKKFLKQYADLPATITSNLLPAQPLKESDGCTNSKQTFSDLHTGQSTEGPSPAENLDVSNTNTTSMPVKDINPVLEYENLSEDDEFEVDQAACKSPEPAKIIEDSKSPTQILSSWSEDNDVSAKLTHNDSAMTPEEAQSAPTKKKVSLQEYLKRSKDVRKNSAGSVEIADPPKATTSSFVKENVSETNTLPSNGIPTIITSQANSPSTESPTITTRQNSETSKDRNLLVSDETLVENLSKLITEAAKPAIGQSKLSDLSSALSTGAIKTLPAEVMDIVTKTVKQLTEDSDGQNTPKNGSVNSSDLNGPRLKNSSKTSPALSNSSRSTQDSCKSPSARSNSSGTSHRARSGSSAGETSKKSSFSNTQSHTSSTAAKHLPSQSSPATPNSVPSPRSPRVAINSLRSPSTPTIYDHRHNSRGESTKDNVLNNSRSRHNSGASSGSSSNLSTRSPRPGSSLDYHSSKHPSTSGSYKLDSHPRVPANQPQKVPSLTPAVPGQPIPSLMRGPGGVIPQVIYNSRPAPVSSRSSQNSPPPWDDYRPTEPPGRPPKEPHYSRPPYYPPGPPPEPPGGGYRRNSYDKPYYDRYSHPYPRREEPREDYLPPKHSPPPPPYYHHNSYYPEGKGGYFPPREARPVSPGPHHRHGPPEYYNSKRKSDSCYRSSFYAPDMHRR
uniref:Flocculation protein FLO11 n=1 Tax=Phallusia mammillata TaxID=59560 RepID=A0A6F9DFE2_9ASCI|nr:flocculation protein FLO11 [Phallusia mammillata]